MSCLLLLQGRMPPECSIETLQQLTPTHPNLTAQVIPVWASRLSGRKLFVQTHRLPVPQTSCFNWLWEEVSRRQNVKEVVLLIASILCSFIHKTKRCISIN